MWTLALASLAVLAVLVDCACPGGFEPLNKTMRRLAMNDSMTWSEVDDACSQQFGIEFQMLDRDFLLLSEEEMKLCQGHSVPLRLSKKSQEPVVWTESEYISNEEEVNSTYLTHMLPDEVPPRSFRWQVGSLDLSTGQWRLVDNNTNFNCAICQRVWIKTLKSFKFSPPSRQHPFFQVYTFRLVETGKNKVGVDEALRLAGERLNQTRDPTGDPLHATVSRVPCEDGVGNKTCCRMKATWLVSPEEVLGVLNGLYSLESWQNRNWCPDTTFEGLYWKKKPCGSMGEVRLQDSQVATRWCSWGMYPDGDWDAVWEDEIFLWIDRSKQCRARDSANLVRRLRDYAERVGPDGLDLKSLVEITADADEIDFQERDWQPNINGSRAIVGALCALLAASATNTSGSRACQGNACAFRPVDLLISPENALPSVINFNKSSVPNKSSYMSLKLPQTLTSAGHFSLHSWRDLENTKHFAMAAQVVSNRPFNESEQESSRPPVDFYLDNTQLGIPFEDWRRVFSLGESKESTLPCPLVRSEGTVDTYSCNKWERGPRNFTVGSFIAYSQKEVDLIRYELFVKPVLIGYTTIPLDESALFKVALFTALFIGLRNAYTINKLGVDTLNPWQEILSGVVLTEPVFTASLEHVKVLVSDLTVNDPVVGFSLDRLDGAGAVQNVTASSRNNITAKSVVDLVLGGDLQEHCTQLAILAVSGVEDFYFGSSLEAYIKRKLMLVYLVVTSKIATEDISGNVYFEIQLPGEFESKVKHRATKLDAVAMYDFGYEDSEGVEDVPDIPDVVGVVDNMGLFLESSNNNQSGVNRQKLTFQVATWSEADGKWFVSSCVKRRSTRDLKPVVRCESLTFTDGALRSSYLIFEPLTFAEALGPTFISVLIAAGFLSGVSLASIAGTVVFLPAWRKDLGHKILLQMALALSFNLALGFTSSFVSVDTASVACIAVGALRHFSYLAMFAWMLVMSGLQLRRLLSVLGARSTPNLILKVSFFAWGVPFFAIVSLLTIKSDMYQSDTADRGYCYPEGTAFTWSVQAPAATVLAMNAVIFLVILARLYSFLGWGKRVDLRRHLNERVFQMRRVRAVLYTFCLFGITWLFHLLAEQGVFQNKYLYEYLFLMTASVHVFSLSCIFVFFDPEARAEWAQVVAPLRVRLGTWIISLRDRFGA